MKKLFSSLPFRLILGIAVGILCGLVFPESAMKVIVTGAVLLLALTIDGIKHMTQKEAK